MRRRQVLLALVLAGALPVTWTATSSAAPPTSMAAGGASAGTSATAATTTDTAATASTTTTTPPQWSPPLALGAGAEPSIRTLPSGSVDQQAAVVSAPTGLGSNYWYIDDHVNSDGTHWLGSSAPQQPDLGTGGGDSEISVGRLAPGQKCPHIAYTGLHNIDLLDNFTAARSDDCGESFTNPPNLYATQNTATDRQWQSFDGSLTNHLIYHKVDTGQIVDSVSYDGGFTYVTLGGPAGLAAIGSIVDPAHAYTQPNLKIGNIVTDYAHPVAGKFYPPAPVGSGEQIHTLYAIFAGTANAAETLASQSPTAGYDYLDTLYLAKSVDGGVTWKDSTIFSVPAASRRELDLVFPVIATDVAGNLYAAWSDGFKIQYVSSTNGGTSWSKPFQVNVDNRGTVPDKGHANLFPWIVGGGSGKLDVVWYHGVGGDTSAYRNPGTNDAVHGTTVWTVAFAQLFLATRKDANGASLPQVTTNHGAITPIIHKGSVCNNGTVCGITGPGDRTLLDFFQVALDASGRANIAYASDVATPGTATTYYTRQNYGYSAYSGANAPVYTYRQPVVPTGTSCPGPQVVDRSGDAAGSVLNGAGERNIPSDDILNVRFTTPSSSTLRVRMTLNNLSATPSTGTASTEYDVYWSYGGKTYFVSATSNGPGLQTYDSGTVTDGTRTATGTPTGTFTTGPNGYITWTLPRSSVGNPPNGAKLTTPSGETHGAFTVAGSGLHYVAAVDRAPDAGSGAPYTVGGAC
jgi:hypothetical protein